MPTDRIIESSQQSAVGAQPENREDQRAGSAAETEDQILSEKGFYWREKNGVRVLVCRALEEKGFINGFSTRLGGVSPMPENDLNLSGFDDDTEENIMENRRRFLNVFGGDFTLATAWQVHGADVKTVGNLEDARDGNARFDALVSNLPGVLVGVKTADCVPILLGDVKTKSFAAVHAGWRGTAQWIVIETFKKMYKAFGTKPKDLICAIGPSASCKNYEIGAEVIEEFERIFPYSDELLTPTRENHALIDLPLANRALLLGLGVSTENIHTAPFCTLERTDLFFSYRKEKRLHGKTGRLLSVIGIK